MRTPGECSSAVSRLRREGAERRLQLQPAAQRQEKNGKDQKSRGSRWSCRGEKRACCWVAGSWRKRKAGAKHKEGGMGRHECVAWQPTTGAADQGGRRGALHFFGPKPPVSYPLPQERVLPKSKNCTKVQKYKSTKSYKEANDLLVTKPVHLSTLTGTGSLPNSKVGSG